MEINIALVQYTPQFGNPKGTMEDVNTLLQQKLTPGQVDIIALPEMSFTGYEFYSKAEIEPFLEKPCQGSLTFEWCCQCSAQYQAIVVAGYPELGDDGKYYNSIMLVSQAGKLIFNYRKTFLFDTDKF